MPLVSTIIARLLAIQDWFLAQWVDVSAYSQASPNECWRFDVQNATLNACGQEFLGAEFFEEWIELLAEIDILIPSLFAL